MELNIVRIRPEVLFICGTCYVFLRYNKSLRTNVDSFLKYVKIKTKKLSRHTTYYAPPTERSKRNYIALTQLHTLCVRTIQYKMCVHVCMRCAGSAPHIRVHIFIRSLKVGQGSATYTCSAPPCIPLQSNCTLETDALVCESVGFCAPTRLYFLAKFKLPANIMTILHTYSTALYYV